jgi:hypothetical protein
MFQGLLRWILIRGIKISTWLTERVGMSIGILFLTLPIEMEPEYRVVLGVLAREMSRIWILSAMLPFMISAIIPHCKKRHLRSVPFLKQFRLFTEKSGKELNVKESSLKISEEVFP